MLPQMRIADDQEESKQDNHDDETMRHLEMLKSVLEQYSAQEASDLFSLYSDTR